MRLRGLAELVELLVSAAVGLGELCPQPAAQAAPQLVRQVGRRLAKANRDLQRSATTFVPGPFLSPTPGLTCVAGSGGFCPDLRKDEGSLRLAIMVKF